MKPNPLPNPQELLSQAIRHHQAGRLEEAQSSYRQVLAMESDNAGALQMLGVLSHQTGNSTQAIELLRRAIRLKPTTAEYRVNLGAILASEKRWEEAVAQFREGIRLRPNLPEAYHNLGRALRELGQLDEAIEAYEDAICHRSGYPDALHNLGDALLAKGLARDAIEAFGRALSARPNSSQTWNNLGNAHRAIGDLDEALKSYRHALELDGNSPEILNNLAITLHEKGLFDEAVKACRQAIAINDEYADAHLNLGNILRKLDRMDEAIAEYRRVLELRPDFADAHANLGSALRDVGLADEALSCFRKAMSLTDRAWPGSALGFTLYFRPDFGPDRIREEHGRWNDRYAKPLMPTTVSFANDRTSDRRLRIGYVSPDFRRHSQSQFTIPLLSHHDHERFEIFCYSSVTTPDELTRRIRGYADCWRDVGAFSDQQVARVIREDKIDILVDLTMHMDRNRLLVFACKPTPVQVTWLAYPGTTGLTAIDYRLSDPHLDPPGQRDEFYSERTIRLPDSFWCYDPLTNEPSVNPLPALRNHFITFGCLNNFAKITDLTLDVWGRVMNRVADSRLLLLAPPGSARQRIVEKLRLRDVDEKRVEFVGRQPRSQYLRTYHRIDLCLDTFPYNGHTTTLDSLWMGVPPVTMSGATAVSRGGLSILTNVGLDCLIAADPEGVVETAAKLCADLSALEELRLGLRTGMKNSPLMDGARFAGHVETAYRQMWSYWTT